MDASKKTLLVINDDAKYIKEGFELLATGIYNQKEVFNKLTAKGFKSSMTALPLFLEIIYIMVVFLLKDIKMKKRQLLMEFMNQLFQRNYFLKFRIF